MWLEEWKIKRNNNVTLIGSSDESFGNSLCQLQSLENIRLTLPEFISQNVNKKHINLKVNFNKDKKIYKYLQEAIRNKKAFI